MKMPDSAPLGRLGWSISALLGISFGLAALHLQQRSSLDAIKFWPSRKAITDANSRTEVAYKKTDRCTTRQAANVQALGHSRMLAN